MIFSLLKWYAKLAIKFYCRKIIVNKPAFLQAKGPVLYAANHPNSFLDGIILTTLLDNDLYSLARGDAFRNERIKKLLYKLHLLPVYRTSEGVENLTHNYSTFVACQEVFREGKSAIIFSEGRCINEWHLRPLRKGTARLAISSWEKGIDLTVVPTGFNYNTFRNYGKNVFLNFGEALDKGKVLAQPTEGKKLLEFNRQLEAQLRGLVYEIDPSDKSDLKRKVSVAQPLWKIILLTPFAALGWLFHLPFYYPLKAITNAKFNNDHFDSVIVALTIILYPLFLLLFFVTCCFLFGGWSSLLLSVLLLFSAWACIQLKPQLIN